MDPPCLQNFQIMYEFGKLFVFSGPFGNCVLTFVICNVGRILLQFDWKSALDF